MDIVMLLLMILAVINGCIGMHPQNIEWTPELKKKLIDIFCKTSPFTINHSEQILDVWNRENPLYKVSNHKALHNLALTLIEDSNKEGKYPAVNIGQIEWTRDMQVDLLYIRHRVRKERGGIAKKIAAKWRWLYPRLNFHPLALERYSRYLEDQKFHFSKEEIRKSEKKYDEMDALCQRVELMKRHIKWTPELKTDLLYIAQQLQADEQPQRPYFKMLWDQMHKEYSFGNEETLLLRLKRLKSEGFVPKAKDLEDAKARYDRLPSIGPKDNKDKKRSRQKGKTPMELPQPDPHEWHQPFYTTPTVEHHGPSSSHPVDYTYHQTMSGSDTAGATSSYYRGEHVPGGVIPSPSQSHQYEIHPQHLNDPIFSPTYQDDYSYPFRYDVHPFTPSFDPYMYHPSHDPGEGSSSQPPGDNRGQHPPQP